MERFVEQRQQLYYGEYRYGLAVNFEHAGRLRNLDPATIIKRVNWINNLQAPWVTTKDRDSINTDYLEYMLEIAGEVRARHTKFKRVTSYYRLAFYSNDLLVLEDMATKFTRGETMRLTEAQDTLPADVVYLKKSVWRYRTFLSNILAPLRPGIWSGGLARPWRRLKNDPDQLATFANFVLSRPEQFGVTPQLRERLSNPYYVIRDSHFIDHMDPGDALMLAMILPGVVRKTLPIMTAPPAEPIA